MSKLYVEVGQRGSGKTLLLVYLATQTKREVFAQFNIRLPNYRELSLSKIMNIPHNSEVYFDEGYIVADSRNSGSSLNKRISHQVFQLRKANRNIHFAVQKFSTLDIRLRIEWDVLIKCARIYNRRDMEEWDFGYSALIKVPARSPTLEQPFDLVEKNWIIPYDYANKKLFRLYDTEEIIAPIDEKRMELDILKQDPEEFERRALEIAEEVSGMVAKPTWASVKYALFKLGYPQDWWEAVYLELNNKIL